MRQAGEGEGAAKRANGGQRAVRGTLVSSAHLAYKACFRQCRLLSLLSVQYARCLLSGRMTTLRRELFPRRLVASSRSVAITHIPQIVDVARAASLRHLDAQRATQAGQARWAGQAPAGPRRGVQTLLLRAPREPKPVVCIGLSTLARRLRDVAAGQFDAGRSWPSATSPPARRCTSPQPPAPSHPASMGWTLPAGRAILCAYARSRLHRDHGPRARRGVGAARVSPNFTPQSAHPTSPLCSVRSV